jgi:prevent-host-death family protein
MRSVNMHDAKTHLSRLVEDVVGGESIIIAKAGRPAVKLVPLDAIPSTAIRRTGFLAGRIQVPDDFDQMASSEIQRAFEGRE